MDLVKNNIENKIHFVRGVQVMLDSDLATLSYKVCKFKIWIHNLRMNPVFKDSHKLA